jgi:Fe-S cluster biosynthesis and repair protein YggX
MARIVKCAKLQRDLPAMPYKPFNDALGERIYNEISMEAWKLWIEHSKMVVNEYRLDLTQADAHKQLKQQCEQFLFGDGAALPPDFVQPAAK